MLFFLSTNPLKFSLNILKFESVQLQNAERLKRFKYCCKGAVSTAIKKKNSYMSAYCSEKPTK